MFPAAAGLGGPARPRLRPVPLARNTRAWSGRRCGMFFTPKLKGYANVIQLQLDSFNADEDCYPLFLLGRRSGPRPAKRRLSCRLIVCLNVKPCLLACKSNQCGQSISIFIRCPISPPVVHRCFIFDHFLLRKASAMQGWHSSEPVRNPFGSFRSLVSAL